MKRILFILAVILVYSFAKSQTSKLTVKITPINDIKGQVHIALYNNSDVFLDEGKEYKMAIVNVKSSTVTYTFSNLPKGWYAVAIFHDVNCDGECNRNFLGIPTEPYGFSNNVTPTIMAPSFDDCKILVSGNTTISIKPIY
ncbi:MAG: DUF2141 domain-containing protein [Bacteroidales bacterium]|jgi:uncharacterized protein (DUF2141 family)